ncbi:glucan 1,3-beta-glucosidase, partial [Lecanoromycetidae sp. Uapishka_2]
MADPLRPPRPSHQKTRTRHTSEREERKERGTPEKSRTRYNSEREERKVYGTPEKTRTPRRRDGSPERSPRQDRECTAQKRKIGKPERKERERTRERQQDLEYERERRYEEVVVEYEEDDIQGSEEDSREPSLPPPTERRPRKEDRRRRSPERDKRRSPERKSRAVVEEKHRSFDSESTTESFVKSSHPLSLDSLAQLDAINEKTGGHGAVREREKKEKVYSEKERRRTKEKVVTGRVEKDKVKYRRRSGGSTRYERRVVSGPLLEEGRKPSGRRGGYVSADEKERQRWFKKKKWIALGLLVLVVLIVVVAVIVSKKKSPAGAGGGVSTGGGGDPSNDNLNGVNESDIPTAAKNTVLDPFTWYDTTDFNVTYTNDTVGGLPVMGLNSTWNDTVQANQFVPSLDKAWAYGQMPIRGVNLGGWLSIEPFITPSLFNTYQSNQGIVDEWTLCKQLGPSTAAKTIEKHYSQFITEDDFQQIQAAGFDHVRIPFSYWAVTTYADDTYVPKISWRYLLRGIEYARKYGLRPRYKNIITIYGLVNEPKMTELSQSAVVDWTMSAAQIVRKSGINATIAFGDGFLGLTKWQGQLQGVDNLVLDAHEYTIFDANLIVMNHTAKAGYACTGWTGQMKQSTDKTTGYSDAYKSWLMTNAEAQMSSFETAWGWFYWTWTTESATQWDYKKGMAAGILPKKVWDRNFNCTSSLPSFDGLSENY